jgi:lysylphosphatidylglycerol synthetase-like protein (DUF2156 family)
MSPGKRPTAVSVIAWTWIITGGFAVFSGIMSLLMFAAMPTLQSELSHAPGMSQGVGLMTSMFRYFGWLVAVQLVLAAVAIVAGIQFLRLRSWARAALEILSWVSLIYVVGFGLFWLSTWSTMTGQFSQQDVQFDTGTLRIVGLAVGAVITLAFAIPLGIMIKYLRGKVVREAMLRDASPTKRDQG